MAENEPGASTEEIVDTPEGGGDQEQQIDSPKTLEHRKKAIEGATAEHLAGTEKPAFKAAVKPLVEDIHARAGREVGMETLFTKGTGAVAGVQEVAQAGLRGLETRAEQDEIDFLESLPGVSKEAQRIANEEAAEKAKFEAEKAEKEKSE